MGVWIETYAFAPRYLDFKVTPCMGVWIETELAQKIYFQCMSHPVWVCGLKPKSVYWSIMMNQVTPCMGVWIETQRRMAVVDGPKVTPCMGVWIETKPCKVT